MKEMHLAFHGGKCCGIKTLYNLGDHPDRVIDELPKVAANNSDQNGHDIACHQRFFHLSAPRETGKERLDRYIEFLAARRPSHLLEVTLAERYQAPWLEYLPTKGFKVVTRFYNSNSGNWVQVLHLTLRDGKVYHEEA